MTFERVTLRDKDFASRPEREWVSTESTFENCKFDNLRVTQFRFGAGLEPSRYIGCSFDGSQIRALTPGRATFEGCTFRGVHLTKWLCNEVEMVDCVFQGRLKEVQFNARVHPTEVYSLGRAKNRFLRNDFSAAEFYGVSFRGGVDLTGQRLPEDGYLLISNAAQVLPSIIEEVRGWPESDQQEEVLPFLEVKMGAVEGGQTQLLISPNDLLSREPTRGTAYERLRSVIVAHVERAR